ncbi:hypothetical protein [Planctomycetes bacterium K23_9]|uniref:Uncharacterized protein n=1 Tax=Stieleria marina TaxID=1930275 RepID=A0A517NVC7_9BACT|nr:hypothetical protein K239x_30710 [Planctomycetes bacterium K23_9]
MSWFKQLTGIDEESPPQVRRDLSVDGDCIVCPDGRRIAWGSLHTPQLAELRSDVADSKPTAGRSTLREIVGDARQLHRDPSNANAIFQVASQFNLLEMTSPSVTPDQGVGIYENDPTQGPACAIACGAGTIYRNYFAPVRGSDGLALVGQTADHQIDCAAELGKTLGQAGQAVWSMENGYLFPTDSGLDHINARLQSASATQRDALRSELRIGIQANASVTLPGAQHRVSQAYCSALPVAYGRQPADAWADFAKLILEAAYEATFCASVLNADRTGSRKVYLTLLGGGVFGNRDEWITAAIARAFRKYRDWNLDVAIVSYRQSKPVVAELVSML